MEQIEPIVIAAIQRDGLRLRSLVQDFLRSETVIADIPRPQTNDELILALSAALLGTISAAHKPGPSFLDGWRRPCERAILSIEICRADEAITDALPARIARTLA